MRRLLQRTLCRRSELSADLTLVSFLVLLAGFCWVLVGSTPALGASVGDGYNTYYVAPNADCGRVEPCYGSIQEAVNAVDEPTDVVKVAKGTYSVVSGSGMRRQVVYIGRPLTLQGGYSTTDWLTSRPDSNPTIIDAGGAGRGVVIEGVPVTASVTLDGFIITNGSATGQGGYYYQNQPLGDAGGGVYINNAVATIRNCELHHNTATTSTFTGGWGGGLFAVSAAVTLQDSSVHDNAASAYYMGGGGGIGLARSAGWSTIVRTVVRNNVGGNAYTGLGGGIYVN